MAFRQELQGSHPHRVALHPFDEVGLLPLEEIIGTPRPDTLVYACGPEQLLAAMETHCARWPAGSLHVERFSPKEIDLPAVETAFEVELARTGVVLDVPPDRSVLDVVEDAGVPMLSSCGEGTCGTCETRVLSGTVDHRDSLLTPEEQAVHDTMFICVSRAACPRLLLDL